LVVPLKSSLDHLAFFNPQTPSFYELKPLFGRFADSAPKLFGFFQDPGCIGAVAAYGLEGLPFG
jgi:hypothetical protein